MNEMNELNVGMKETHSPSPLTHVHLVAEEQVAQFEIAVDDVIVVEVLDAEGDLFHEVTRFRFRHGFAPLMQLHQRPPPAQLQQDVDIFRVLEEAEELDDVVMLEGLVDRDLLRHLLLGVLLDEQALGHDLARHHLLRLQVLEFVTAREPTLAHKLALLIALARGRIHDQVGHVAQRLSTRRGHDRR